MRLIDADALKEKIIDLLEIEWGYEGIRENVSRIIDSMPTIEERPHGEWKKTTHAIVCSNCGHNIEHRLFGAYMRYCCVCGSDNWREGEAE